jgi:hypothetical protein
MIDGTDQICIFLVPKESRRNLYDPVSNCYNVAANLATNPYSIDNAIGNFSADAVLWHRPKLLRIAAAKSAPGRSCGQLGSQHTRPASGAADGIWI